MALADYLIKNYPDCIFSLAGNDISSLTWKEDNPVAKPSEDELLSNLDHPSVGFSEQEIKSLEAAAQKTAYQNLRANEYPSIADQLDTIFHDGLDVWKAQIQAVKDKYPKAGK